MIPLEPDYDDSDNEHMKHRRTEADANGVQDSTEMRVPRLNDDATPYAIPKFLSSFFFLSSKSYAPLDNRTQALFQVSDAPFGVCTRCLGHLLSRLEREGGQLRCSFGQFQG